MKSKHGLTVGIFLLALSTLSAATLYVSSSSLNPTPPYATWATAATSIQDAVDAASAGDKILVTNGIYATGGRVVGTGLLTNRVVVDKPITLQSVNGPDVTIIQGHQVPGTTNGDAAIRCVYLGAQAVLSGFTLTQGATRQGSGPWGSYEDSSGGGVQCLIGAWVMSCKLIDNSAGGSGGGAAGGTLDHCTLTGNSANEGGGAYGGALKNCLLTGNSANRGGGAFASEVNNCTVTGNTAVQDAGGVGGGVIYNSIIYYNTALNNPNWAGSKGGIIAFCCTTPLPAPENWRNIDAEPRFVSLGSGDFRLQADSPCINAGNNAYAPGTTDLDGKPRIVEGSVDMGAYEFQSSTAPSITLQPFNQTVFAGTNVTFRAAASGALPLFWQWQFNSAAIPGATNSSYTIDAVTITDAGGYSVFVSNALGSATSAVATLTVIRPSAISYVWQNSPNPASPFTSWDTAAHTIQDAVDVAMPGDVIVVTNGIYATGGRVVGTSLLT
ncbi:MAG TPA: immunoglobulin domain-containing protein, partial [Clostridia bacterium]|nr:immunoglobulin domain-containing protein [Clostridia bacterium]